MSEQTASPQDLVNRDNMIELLARETDMPIEIVHRIYDAEHTKLEQTARIKTYVPVLIHRHVKDILQSLRAAP